ncbi:MAG: knotted carbamoyltransferase YgeW [Lentimicrobiaceae bacterium]|nr:knotted carbamoyltransferase YgeW [Lentimicrobiaceae bacterium]
MDFKKITEQIAALKTNLYQKDFLLTWDKTPEELMMVMLVAEALRSLRNQNISTRCFDSGLGISNFRDNSTRTRFSFASACNLLGLEVQDLDEGTSQIAHGETVRETANMISFLTEIIGIRDDMFLGEGHKYMSEVGEALEDGYKHGVLPQRPGIVNLQCDIDHPTQSMADLLHLVNYFGGIENLKGKKIAMTWAYSPSYGKPLSVPQGIIGLMTRFGMQVKLAYPEGYSLIPEVVELAGKNAKASGGSFHVMNSMEEAFTNADIVYPKSWAPFSVMERRTALLKNNDRDGLKALEQECLANNARFKHWECNDEKMKITRDGKALYMHCLPADISGVSCREGEVAANVFERYRIETYKEAGYKPYIIAAMMLTNRFANPAAMLNSMLERGNRRAGL